MSSLESNIDKYAELAVKVGVNIQPGQMLVITASIDAVNFVHRVANQAYKAGASDVHVEWTDEGMTHARYQHAEDSALQAYPEWRARGFEQMAKDGAAFLYINSANPDLLKDISAERVAMAAKARAIAMKNYNNMTQSAKVAWSIVAVPSTSWAQSVFPEADTDEAVERLWAAILKATRADMDNPVSAWTEHIQRLRRNLTHLNGKKYKQLQYRAPGTDLTVELPEGHVWVGGGLTNAQGVYFVPNMPTEEVFSLPARDGVHGTVRSTRPLSYGGQVINHFSLTFEQGRIVSFSAEEGYSALEKLLATDEGARHLGEVALVPNNSPITQLNITFKNTLFDENASCHFAIGNAYPLCLEGGTDMTKEALEARGANTSLTHVDFMAGSAELDVDGITENGTREPIFRNGNWAF